MFANSSWRILFFFEIAKEGFVSLNLNESPQHGESALHSPRLSAKRWPFFLEHSVNLSQVCESILTYLFHFVEIVKVFFVTSLLLESKTLRRCFASVARFLWSTELISAQFADPS